MGGKKRMIWGLTGAVLLCLVLWFLWWSQNAIQSQTILLSTPSLPQAFDGLRILHISDLHGKEFGEGSGRLLKRAAELKPDLIAITGDLIDQEDQLEMVPALARGLADIAPTYYVTGNHEWAVRRVNDLKVLLQQCGVRVLTNEYDIWEKEGVRLAVAGIDDPNGPPDQKTGPELRREIRADYTVLLAHRDQVEAYEDWGYDLVLCGHGHGGILRIPILDQGLFSTDRTLFPKYDGGPVAYSSGGICFVSRGMGNNTVPFPSFRLFNRPDLPLLILKKQCNPGQIPPLLGKNKGE